jgi:hypothetical protein
MIHGNRLVLIGNGFDLAHGFKTSYKNFMDWYMCDAYQQFLEKNYYNDTLFEIKNKSSRIRYSKKPSPQSCEDIIELISGVKDYQSINYTSNFFKILLDNYLNKSWVDIECFYFQQLKEFFSSPLNHKRHISKLNSDFDFLILKLSEYIKTVNDSLVGKPKLNVDSSHPLFEILSDSDNASTVKFLNFNYTDTLQSNEYASEEEVIHIHGRASDKVNNPIIFGYGDETDPVYQKIEDTGENLFLEHIKSFGYFTTNNYQKLISFLDSASYRVYIIGHSCGLSDRVLLNEIFEHPNCNRIEIFYHVRKDGTDNYKEITQQISRHFKPQNKNMMRRRVGYKMYSHIIPQNNPS